jgi:hypothetical protein
MMMEKLGILERRIDEFWTMKKLGIRRLDATLSHLVTK